MSACGRWGKRIQPPEADVSLENLPGQAASSARWAEADPIKTCLALSRSPNYALKEGKKRGTSKGRERRRRKKGRGRNRLVELEPGPPGYCYLGRSQWVVGSCRFVTNLPKLSVTTQLFLCGSQACSTILSGDSSPRNLMDAQLQ